MFIPRIIYIIYKPLFPQSDRPAPIFHSSGKCTRQTFIAAWLLSDIIISEISTRFVSNLFMSP